MTKELLRARAERGHPRGAGAVWADANRQLIGAEQTGPWDRSAMPFRFAVAAAALLLAGVAAAFLTDTRIDDLPIVTDPADNGGDDEASPGDPAPILIEGMMLDAVVPPVDLVEYCAERPVEDVNPETGAPVSNECRERSFAVFANPDQPFTDTIVVLETLPNGDYELSGVNLGERPLDAFGDAVVQAESDGESLWSLGSSVGLQEVARFDDTANVQAQAGWIFDYRSDEPARVALQTELDVDGAGVWRWIARLATGFDRDPKVAAPVDVLGTTGVQLDFVGRDEADILWVSAGRTYRMSADDPDADDFTVVTASPFVERLRIAERPEWQAAVDDASTAGFEYQIPANYTVIGLIAVAGIGGYFVLLRRQVLRHRATATASKLD